MFGARVRALRRQEFVATYKVPVGVGRRLRHQLGESADLGPAYQGLYQWLRISCGFARKAGHALESG